MIRFFPSEEQHVKPKDHSEPANNRPQRTVACTGHKTLITVKAVPVRAILPQPCVTLVDPVVSSEVWAFGDDLNDVRMLSEVGEVAQSRYALCSSRGPAEEYLGL